ncbi:MAG: DUF4159 domain-containing protein [Candidatus Tectomicrobia bacterium]|uniref:DUF4159 domain-containing protein n=1 Tax=Tectimicrobiota bacterium TaxID=2528274 RepID=A0A932M0K4_UNCTE|nr:DUF4159 domain-containing protein [Candidatus Tectomicrobia bacterium]
MDRRQFLLQSLGALGTLLLGSAASAQTLAQSHSRFTFAQLRYRGGTWDPHPNAQVEFLRELTARTSVDAASERKVLSLTDRDLFQYPFLYMTGRNEFAPFSPEEMENLRKFASLGGLLFVDDASGTPASGFDKSLRSELERAFAQHRLERLSQDHSAFRSFYLLRNLGGRRIVNPFLLGITLDNWTPLLYTQNDVGSAWERDYLGNWRYEAVPGGETQRSYAFRLGINVVLYALTADYKRDLIHLPFLRRKVL